MTETIDLTSYNPDDIPEARLHTKGTEVFARISRVTTGLDKNSENYMMPWFEDSEDPNIEDFSDFMSLPNKDATEKENGKRLRKIEAFGRAFDINILGSNTPLDQMKGLTGYVIVGTGTNQDGDDCNTVSKYVAQG